MWAHRRFAKRVPGEGWTAEIRGFSGAIRVRDISRIGIGLETSEPLEPYRRYPLELTGPAGGSSGLAFYVLRCPEDVSADGRVVFLPAGLFLATVSRDDLPDAIPESPDPS
jgi:hypothetical protein